jgi:hypothetical protein
MIINSGILLNFGCIFDRLMRCEPVNFFMTSGSKPFEKKISMNEIKTTVMNETKWRFSGQMDFLKMEDPVIK